MSEKTTKKQTEQAQEEKKPTCGIVMPISTMDEIHNTTHWNKVLRILKEAISEVEFEPKPVWESEETNIIHKNIVQNLHDCDIVICDVSCNNPNVMFELGLRLAFDKPTIIVAEKGSKLSFDTAMIEHVMYPQNLDYYDIGIFKKEISKKIKDTYKKSVDDPDYSVFLKHFKEIKPSVIQSIEGSVNDIILEKVEYLSEQVSKLNKDSNTIVSTRVRRVKRDNPFNQFKEVEYKEDSDSTVGYFHDEDALFEL